MSDISHFYEGLMQVLPYAFNLFTSGRDEQRREREDTQRRNEQKQADIAEQETEDYRTELLMMMLSGQDPNAEPIGYTIGDEMSVLPGSPLLDKYAAEPVMPEGQGPNLTPWGETLLGELESGKLSFGDAIWALNTMRGMGQDIYEPEEVPENVSMEEMPFIVSAMRGDTGAGFLPDTLRTLGEQTGTDYSQEITAYQENREIYDAMFPMPVEPEPEVVSPYTTIFNTAIGLVGITPEGDAVPLMPELAGGTSTGGGGGRSGGGSSGGGAATGDYDFEDLSDKLKPMERIGVEGEPPPFEDWYWANYQNIPFPEGIDSQTEREGWGRWYYEQTGGAPVETGGGEVTIPGPSKQAELIAIVQSMVDDGFTREQIIAEIDAAVTAGEIPENYAGWLKNTLAQVTLE